MRSQELIEWNQDKINVTSNSLTHRWVGRELDAPPYMLHVHGGVETTTIEISAFLLRDE